jgi:hypothetical protein
MKFDARLTLFNRMQNNRLSNFSRGKVAKTCFYAA